MVGVSQDLVAFRFDRVTISKDERLAVKLFLNGHDLSSTGHLGEKSTCQAALLYQENACVGLEVHTGRRLYGLRYRIHQNGAEPDPRI